MTEIVNRPCGTGTPDYYVRDVPVYGDTILAPMDGYSDWPFRSICRSLGSAMSYSEFVKVEHVLHSPRHTRAKLYYEEAERPVVFQIYGDDVEQIVQAALAVQELGPDIIDINMGCPAKSVAARGAGVGLMRTPLKIARLFRKLGDTLRVPFTGKIRLGWDDMRTYKLVARIVEENGGSLIAIHGRTKEQSYGGQADWDAIAEVKAAVSIPVVGNGDVKTVADIDRLKQYTGCEAVMIGRAAIANPWIFSRLDRDQVSPERVRAYRAAAPGAQREILGPEDGQRLFRKHAVQYLLMRTLTVKIASASSRCARRQSSCNCSSRSTCRLRAEACLLPCGLRPGGSAWIEQKFCYTVSIMAKTHTRYVCQECGRVSATYMGKCPQCGSFNSMIEELVHDEPLTKGPTTVRGLSGRSQPRPIGSVGGDTEERIELPMEEFARVLGGGIVPGSIVLVGGDPGIGKSTLLLQMAVEMAARRRVLYVSGRNRSGRSRCGRPASARG